MIDIDWTVQQKVRYPPTSTTAFAGPAHCKEHARINEHAQRNETTEIDKNRKWE